jgi:proline dehydrogenase
MLRRFFLWCSESAWLADRLPRMPFVRRSVQRFVPGEKVDDALAAAGRLLEVGIASVLTRLGEHVHSEAEAAEVTDHYLDVLARHSDAGSAPEISVKLTQLGLEVSTELARQELLRLCGEAGRRGNFVWVDMEDSPYVDRTLELYRSARLEHDNVGLCLQAYLRRTAKDLDGVLSVHGTVRLVKGAYDEPAHIAFPNKRDVDENFAALSVRLLEHIRSEGGRQAFATHDLELIERVRAAAKAAGVPPDGYEIQMLYGIQSAAQRRLAAEGQRVRTLISYGDQWFAWYMRRLAERPANVAFVLRSLLSA